MVLRPGSTGDRPHLRRWFTDRELRKYTGRRFSLGLGLSETGSDLQFIILLRDDRRPIGLCSLLGISDTGTAEVGIVLGEKDAWGQGYGPEALALLLDHAWRDLGLHEVSLCVRADNARAIRAYEKVGFTTERRLAVGRWLLGKGAEYLIMTRLAPLAASAGAKEGQR